MDEETDDVTQPVTLTLEARRELERALVAQREKFIAEFGREPGPDDLLRRGRRPGARDHRQRDARGRHSPALIYAYEETGLIVTRENRRLIPDADLRDFDAKVREYHDLHLGDDPTLD